MDKPADVDFGALTADLEKLDAVFNDFYGTIATAEDIGAVVSSAEKFKGAFRDFKSAR